MITIISASTRPTDSTHGVALLFQAVLKGLNKDSRIVTPADFDLPYDGAKDPNWTDIITATDLFIIVTPEYNHSFPGRLKTLIDAEYDAYVNKKIIVCGVSSGSFGGARAVLSLLPVLHKVGFDIFPIDIFTPNVKDILENPAETEKYKARVSEILTKFVV
jgi:NAD(P)H-dependent FMN reductase